MLYFNFNTYIIKSDHNGRINATMTPKFNDFLQILESKASYDISKFWQEPATVLRKATEHPCYTAV